MVEALVQDWLEEYSTITEDELTTFAAQHQHNHEVAGAVFAILQNYAKYLELTEQICDQLFGFYRSTYKELKLFSLQFLPSLIYLYLNAVVKGEKGKCRSVETFLISVYNLEILDENGQPRVISFRMPFLAQHSIYHEAKGLAQTDLRRWEECSTKTVNWGPLPHIEVLYAQNRLKVMTALLFIYNRYLSLLPKASLHHLCKAATMLTTQGFSRYPLRQTTNIQSKHSVHSNHSNHINSLSNHSNSMSNHTSSSNSSATSNTNKSQSYMIDRNNPRIPMSGQFLLELLHAVYFAMFNEFASMATSTVEDIHRRAVFELYSDVILVTNAIRHSLAVNPSGQPCDGPMGISCAISTATTTVSVSKSMITNASFRTKKLPDDIPILKQESGNPTGVSSGGQITNQATLLSNNSLDDATSTATNSTSVTSGGGQNNSSQQLLKNLLSISEESSSCFYDESSSGNTNNGGAATTSQNPMTSDAGGNVTVAPASSGGNLGSKLIDRIGDRFGSRAGSLRGPSSGGGGDKNSSGSGKDSSGKDADKSGASGANSGGGGGILQHQSSGGKGLPKLPAFHGLGKKAKDMKHSLKNGSTNCDHNKSNSSLTNTNTNNTNAQSGGNNMEMQQRKKSNTDSMQQQQKSNSFSIRIPLHGPSSATNANHDATDSFGSTTSCSSDGLSRKKSSELSTIPSVDRKISGTTSIGTNNKYIEDRTKSNNITCMQSDTTSTRNPAENRNMAKLLNNPKSGCLAKFSNGEESPSGGDNAKRIPKTGLAKFSTADDEAAPSSGNFTNYYENDEGNSDYLLKSIRTISLTSGSIDIEALELSADTYIGRIIASDDEKSRQDLKDAEISETNIMSKQINKISDENINIEYSSSKNSGVVDDDEEGSISKTTTSSGVHNNNKADRMDFMDDSKFDNAYTTDNSCGAANDCSKSDMRNNHCGGGSPSSSGGDFNSTTSGAPSSTAIARGDDDDSGAKNVEDVDTTTDLVAVKGRGSKIIGGKSEIGGGGDHYSSSATASAAAAEVGTKKYVKSQQVSRV